MPTKTRKSSSQNQAWDIAQSAVKHYAAQLRAMTSYQEIYGWGVEQELNTKVLWPKVKAELRKQLRIDYEALRQGAREQAARELGAAAAEAPTITLCCAGDAEVDSYAVINPGVDGGDPWYGTFFKEDDVTTQQQADVNAAGKAIFLAGKAREHAGLDVVRLHLIVSNHQVAAEDLARQALRARIHVTIEVTDDDNPALEQCRENGYRPWRYVSLNDLLGASEAPA